MNKNRKYRRFTNPGAFAGALVLGIAMLGARLFYEVNIGKEGVFVNKPIAGEVASPRSTSTPTIPSQEITSPYNPFRRR